MEIANDRAYAAQLARRYFYEHSVTIETVFETFGDTADPLIAELLDLIAFEPARATRPGVQHDQYVKKYWPLVAATLQQLELGEAGRVPARGRLATRHFVGLVVLVLFVGASAAENARKIVAHITGSDPLKSWELLLYTAALVLMSVIFLRVVQSLFNAVGMYRGQRARRSV